MARVVVLGASGFLGSHLCDELIARGDEVVGVDDLTSSTGTNLVQLENVRNFTFLTGNIADGIPVKGHVDAVLNFASPASPSRYLETPLHTLRTGSRGTDLALEFALQHEARFLMASTSEIYGDPLVHPQPEAYWGNVNSIGERSCYDEAKRYAEALSMAYWREFGMNIGIVRIFNTYGPRLDPTDGRVVSNFVAQALRGEALTLHGNGEQSRSFCYVDDEIRGILAMLDSGERGPINIGNPNEFTMTQLADLVMELTGCTAGTVYTQRPVDDPTRRCPDISLARELLDWEPKVQLREGLGPTIEWFRSNLFS